MKKTRFAFCGKLIAAIAVIIMIFSLCACGGELASVFADGTSINGVDVSGLTAEEAEAALNAAIENYTFSFTL